MKAEIINRIKGYLKNDYSANIATDDEIKKAEDELGVEFDKDYVEFIKKFGGCYVGVSIYAFKNGSNLERKTIVELTKSFREDGWPFTENSYVVSMDGMGNPIMINEEGKVVMFDHDNNSLIILSNSFEGWISINLPD